jgi:hypothetical protein
MALTDEQQAAADFLVKGAMCDREHIQVFTGPGGAGKSFVMQSFAESANERGGWVTMFATLSHSALKSCPSDHAGLVLAALCIRCRWKNHSKKSPADRMVARWFASRRRVLVIDEAFQLTAEYLETVFAKLQGASAVRRGGVRVILVGDPGQTKPIGGKPITSHPDVQAARWAYLTSGTMRMTPEWAREVRAFGENIVLADASLLRHRCARPPDGTMIVTPTRSDSLSATKLFLAGSGSFTVLPIIPETDEDGGLEARKASEPFICEPGQPARLVYNVRTAEGSRTTPGGVALNNGTEVWFSGLVEKDGTKVPLEPGSEVQLTTKHRVQIHVRGEPDAITLAPYVSAGITVVPTRPFFVKTICAAQGETIDGGVYLYTDGPVRQSDYTTAAGRVRSGDKFFVAPSVTRVEPDK